RALETELRELRRSWGSAVVPGDHPILRRTRTELSEYFDGDRCGVTMPLNQRGSEFQLKAWRALCRIPYGETRSYSDMAREVGSPGAVRAIRGVTRPKPLASKRP